MELEPETLPSHVAQVGRRLQLCHSDDLANKFLETSYLAEVSIKTIAIALLAALRDPAKELAYKYSYALVRADGLGSWERVIREVTNQPIAAYLPPEFFKLLAWVTMRRNKAEDETFRGALTNVRSLLRELGAEEQEGGRTGTVRDLVSALVQIRNKTKAHGAVGQDFYSQANKLYLDAVTLFVRSCPAFHWRWVRFSIQDTGTVRGVELRGLIPRHLTDADAATFKTNVAGIHFVPEQSSKTFFCGEFLRTNPDCTSFLIPNGGMSESGRAEFIDYGSGKTTKQSVTEFISPPAPLPPSETEGMPVFDVQSNVFGNLPDLADGYVQRPQLEAELIARLKDKNHPIITLHGGGGMGKTSLALFVAHQLANVKPAPFEHIVWFSARDIDLRLSGPASVKADVIDLESVARKFCRLFSPYGVNQDVDSFARILQSPLEVSDVGILFIFDNFETMSDVSGLHRFLDEHTHVPNKVLITSRERAFKADYPIEVRGMEYEEAAEMLTKLAEEFAITGLMTETVVDRIYEYTAGHAYVMRVIAGEMAKEGRYTPPAQLLGSRSDIVDAVFERSFNKLSGAGRAVFLTVAGWKSNIPELGILVVLGIRGIDAMSGIDECHRLSLIFPEQTPDGQRSYSVPHLARLFGQKKLQGDPDRLVIQEDLVILQKFGALRLDRREESLTPGALVNRFVQTCFAEIKNGPDATAKADRLLQALANIQPVVWLRLADFRQLVRADSESISYALRRAVEEQPFSKAAWIKRAEFAKAISDQPTRIASLVSAVEADPKDVALIRHTADELHKYLMAHLADIPRARRGVYLASVRSHMEKVASKLDATGFSRLAWLFLLEDNQAKAKHYANKGCELDPTNGHCLKILERLDRQATFRR
jgi:hypothetical protein